jgi:hypothetical protein
MALEEAQGQLQWERAALEEARATLKLRDEEISRLDKELNQLSVSYEDQHQAGEENDATILDLQQAAKTGRTTLVGDSPRGPLKQRGNPHLKPATKPKHDLPNPEGNSPRRRDPDGPSRRPS